MSNIDREKAFLVASDLEESLEAAREAYDEFTEKWTDVQMLLGRLGAAQGSGDPQVLRQIEAYQPFTRDQGMGDGPEAWFENVASTVQDALNAEE